MNEIAVEVRAPTKPGRLYPRLDPDTGFLLLDSTVSRLRRYHLNVSDGLLEFGTDEHRLLSRVTLRRIWDRWTAAVPFPDWTSLFHCPMPGVREADIGFERKTVSQRNYQNVEVETITDRESTRLWILFGTAENLVLPLELSGSCIALVDDGRLIGFYVDIATGVTAVSVLPSIGRKGR